jgi:uncharacterized protein YukE
MNIKTEIEIEFKRAIEQADELDELSDRLCRIGSVKMDEALTILSGSYKGQNATAYIDKTRVIKDRMYDSAEILKRTASMIRTTASVIYEAEMAAVSLVFN